MKIYLDEFESIVDRHDRELLAFGKKIREQIVVPACRKHRLTFTSGMGTFFFAHRSAKSDSTYYGSCADLDVAIVGAKHRLSTSAKDTLRPILDLLNREISHDNYVGYLVDDVD